MTGLIFGDLMTTLSNLVVSIGVDSKDLQKGIKDAQGALQSFKSSAMQLSAIIAGAGALGFGAKAWAESKNELKAYADLLGTTANKLQGVKNTVESSGLSGEEAVSFMQRMALIQRQIATGHGLQVYEELIKNGTTFKWDKKDVTTLFEGIANEWNKWKPEQKNDMLNALGLDAKAGLVFEKGGKHFREMTSRMMQLRPVTDEQLKTSSEFVEKWTLAQAGLGQFIDVFQNRIAKNTIEWMDKFIEFVEKNPDGVKKLSDVIKVCADNVDKLFIGLASITALKFASSITSMITMIGNLGKALTLLAKNPAFIALATVAGAFALIAKNGGNEEDEMFSGSYEDFQKMVDQKLSDSEGDEEQETFWKLRKNWTKEEFEAQKRYKIKKGDGGGFFSFLENTTPSTEVQQDSVSLTDAVARANSVQEQEAQVAEQERKTQERAQRESQNGTGNTLNVNLNLDSNVIKRITAKMYADANGRMRFNGAR